MTFVAMSNRLTLVHWRCIGHPAEVWQGTVFAIPKLLGRGHDSQVGVHVLTARLIASQDPKRGMWPPKHSLGEPLVGVKPWIFRHAFQAASA